MVVLNIEEGIADVFPDMDMRKLPQELEKYVVYFHRPLNGNDGGGFDNGEGGSTAAAEVQ